MAWFESESCSTDEVSFWLLKERQARFRLTVLCCFSLRSNFRILSDICVAALKLVKVKMKFTRFSLSQRQEPVAKEPKVTVEHGAPYMLGLTKSTLGSLSDAILINVSSSTSNFGHPS